MREIPAVILSLAMATSAFGLPTSETNSWHNLHGFDQTPKWESH